MKEKDDNRGRKHKRNVERLTEGRKMKERREENLNGKSNYNQSTETSDTYNSTGHKAWGEHSASSANFNLTHNYIHRMEEIIERNNKKIEHDSSKRKNRLNNT